MKYRNLFYFCIILLFTTTPLSSQDPAADSLEQILRIAPLDSGRVNLLNTISKNYFGSSPEKALKYGEESVELSRKLNFPKGEALGLKNMGIAHYMMGNYLETLQFWQQSLSVYRKINDKAGEANILGNIGAVYFNQSDEANAIEYYLKSLKIAEEINDSIRIATTLSNIGAVYLNKQATYSKALLYFLRSLPYAERLGDNNILGTITVNLGEIYFKMGDDSLALLYFERSLDAYANSENIPYSLNAIGKVYAKRGDYEKAIKYHEEALSISEKLDTRLDIAQSLQGLAKAQFRQKSYRKSLQNLLRAESLAIEIGSPLELKNIYSEMAKAYSEMSDYPNAYKYQTLYANIKDTLYNIETDKKLNSLQFTFDIQKKESEIDLLTKDKALTELNLEKQKGIRNVTIGGLAFAMLFLGVVWSQKKRISKEKQRSEELLLNILPEETAEELKATGTAKAKSFDLVTVMFTDFKNFTQASEKLSAEELVQEINYCYSEFDKIITKHNIEKIKTIGDSYMCAGGLPATNATHPVDVVKAGLEMQEFILRNKEVRSSKGQPFFELRLGIHTGPVVAGIVGIKKFAYDIWGDTVNTASRMESSGEVGKVNVSEDTYQLIKDQFRCTPRGKIAAKNKGSIEMYFVEGPV